MSGISSWLLGIAGVVILSVLAELILPEGQINKYIKVIFSFATLLVIIAPLPSLIGKEFDFSNFFESTTELQEDFLYQINIDKLNAINEDLTSEIKAEGLSGIEIYINANVISETLEIYSIYVDLCDIEYNENYENKNITSAKATILNIIKSNSLLENVTVTFNE